MESNGQRGRIHVSQSTAHLLVEAGLEAWIVSRETLIEAKGKGTLQTYWLCPPVALSHTTSKSYESQAVGAASGGRVGGLYRYGRQTSTTDHESERAEDDMDRTLLDRAVDRLTKMNATKTTTMNCSQCHVQKNTVR